MNKELLENYINKGLSTYKITKESGKSQTTVRYWLKKYGLKSLLKSFKNGGKYQASSGPTSHIIEADGSIHKMCPKCKTKKPLDKSNFYMTASGKVHSWCKPCNNKISHEKQKQMKINAVNLKGGACQICGYCKYVGSLDFHHLDPSKKEYSISKLRTYSLENLKIELAKCICVCSNCHGEIHAGLIELKGVLPDGLEPSTVPL